MQWINFSKMHQACTSYKSPLRKRKKWSLKSFSVMLNSLLEAWLVSSELQLPCTSINCPFDTPNESYNCVSLLVISKCNDLLLKATYLNMKKRKIPKYLFICFDLCISWLPWTCFSFMFYWISIFSNCFLRVFCILRKSALDLSHVSSHLLVGSCSWCITQMNDFWGSFIVFPLGLVYLSASSLT